MYMTWKLLFVSYGSKLIYFLWNDIYEVDIFKTNSSLNEQLLSENYLFRKHLKVPTLLFTAHDYPPLITFCKFHPPAWPQFHPRARPLRPPSIIRTSRLLFLANVIFRNCKTFKHVLLIRCILTNSCVPKENSCRKRMH